MQHCRRTKAWHAHASKPSFNRRYTYISVAEEEDVIIWAQEVNNAIKGFSTGLTADVRLRKDGN